MSDIFELCANVIEAFLIAQFFIRYFKFKNENYKILKIFMFTMAVMFVVTMSNIWAYFSVHEEYIVDVTLLVIMVVFLKGRMLEKMGVS
mgnify:FL=1